MPERIYKLQPDRTVSLRGFNTFAAAASIHSASPSGFSVSGTFRDPGDFAVAVLYDADNVYEHPSIKYLPDFNFSGLTLSFDVLYTDGLQPMDSPKFNWIDWATFDCILENGATAQVPLWDNATLVDPSFPTASATFNVVAGPNGIQAPDRMTLWFQNLAFDYTVPDGSSAVDFQFFAGGTGKAHSITVNGRTYSHTESLKAGESSALVAQSLFNAINAGTGDPQVAASWQAGSNVVQLTVQPGMEGIPISVSASDNNGSAVLLVTTAPLVATALVNEINTTSWISANPSPPYALLASNNGAQITLTAARFGSVNVNQTAVAWVSGAKFAGIAAGSTILLGGSPCTVASVQSPLSLTLSAPPASGTTASGIQYVAPRGGRDGNLLQLYSTAVNDSTGTPGVSIDQSRIQLSGGSSNVTWNVQLDFTALGIDQLRQCWLTFAPSLTNAAYVPTEWQAVFSNWQLAGPETTRALTVAGPGSVRVEESSPSCVFTPAASWNLETGFYSRYFAIATSDTSAEATIAYTCQFQHDLYIGTSLYSDRAVVGVTIDTNPPITLDCRLSTSSAVVTRRLVKSGVAAGKHTVSISLLQAGVFYFDFLEAAVVSDVPDALKPRTGISPALDFDTDQTYKLSPARLMWIMDKLGYAGPMNEYLGVFWWNERLQSGGSVSTAQVSFGGTFASGETVFLTLNGTTLGKTVFSSETPAIVATHFADWINGAYVAAWASASGGTLTITGRSPAPAYNLTVSLTVNSTAGTGVIVQQPQAGAYGTWVVNDAISPPINRATRDWHADYYTQCAARNREVTTSLSMELVNPPAGYAALFPDSSRTPVATDTGFGSLFSNHCAVGSSKLLAYQKAVYRNIAQMQAGAGLTPNLQYGEFLWWYFAGPGGMAFYDDETLAAAQAVLGQPLHVFQTPNDDPGVNGGADSLFLRNRLRDHVAALVADIRSAFPTAKCEVLYPYDVNYPSPVPASAPIMGGRLNRFVNLPVEWQTQPSSGLDRMKVEALAFSTQMRSLDLAKEAIGLFPAFGWPLASLRYLVPVFGSATPWPRELALAIAAGIGTNNLWAFDQVCLFNLAVPEPALERRSLLKPA